MQDAGDQAGAVAAAQRAVDAQAKADAISPEYDELDVEAKAATGLDDPAIEIGEPSPSPTPTPAADSPPAPSGDGIEPPTGDGTEAPSGNGTDAPTGDGTETLPPPRSTWP